MKDDRDKTITIAFIGVLIGMLFVILVALMVKVAVESARSSEAITYDLNCVTELNEKPLTECKNGNK